MAVFQQINLCIRIGLRHERKRNFSKSLSMLTEGFGSQITTKNLDLMESNVVIRKHFNNIPKIRKLVEEFNKSNDPEVRSKLEVELKRLPNLTHKKLLNYRDEPMELERFGAENSFVKTKEFSEICNTLNLFRMDHLGSYTGHKSYYLMGSLAMLEQALIQYSLKELEKNNFKIISVPDILPKTVIEDCGMQTDGERTQVYKLDSNMCLSGTSEMALAGFFSNKIYKESELPIKVCAVSRCYRAETSGLQEEKGIYRVHQFNKVEMFALCTDAQSESMLEHFKNIEISFFQNLELNFRLLDMPPSELGAPAFQKYDIEAWMPGREIWGEISSCSNCTDYQSKRLNIRYISNNGQLKFLHTINGTAAAIPRLLISLIEMNQNKYNISVPIILREFLQQDEIEKDKRIPELKLAKFVKLVK